MQDFKVGATVTSIFKGYRPKQIGEVIQNAGACVRVKWDNGDTTIVNSDCIEIISQKK